MADRVLVCSTLLRACPGLGSELLSSCLEANHHPPHIHPVQSLSTNGEQILLPLFLHTLLPPLGFTESSVNNVKLGLHYLAGGNRDVNCGLSGDWQHIGFRSALSGAKLCYQRQSWNRTAGNCSVNFIWQRLLPASERMLKMLP